MNSHGTGPPPGTNRTDWWRATSRSRATTTRPGYLSPATHQARATDSSWDDTDLDQLKRVPGSAFEAVDTGAVHS